MILFFVALIVIVYLLLSPKKNTINNSIWKEYSREIADRPVYNNFYNVHKGPKEIKYILMHPEVTQLFNDISFTRKYSKHLFLDILIYCEYFFKMHYNVMIEKYDPCNYVPLMQDIRNIIYDLMSEFVFVLPEISTIVDIPNIDKYVQFRTKKLDAILIHYIDIVRHKYYSQCAHLF